MSLAQCISDLTAHFALVRHLHAQSPPTDSFERLAFNQRRSRRISLSLGTITRTYTSRVLRQAFKKLTVEEKPYLYMITFTFDPKKGPINIAKARKYLDSRLTIKELAKREPLTWMYSQETHKSGDPHFHAVLQTKKSVPRSVFRDWCRKFGNFDFSTSTTREILPAIIYITKETVPKVLRISEKARLYLTQSGPRNSSENSETS